MFTHKNTHIHTHEVLLIKETNRVSTWLKLFEILIVKIGQKFKKKIQKLVHNEKNKEL